MQHYFSSKLLQIPLSKMLFISAPQIINLNILRAVLNPAITVMAGLVHLVCGELEHFSLNEMP